MTFKARMTSKILDILYIWSDSEWIRIWPDKSTKSYVMLDFESEIENLYGKYMVIERPISGYIVNTRHTFAIFKVYCFYYFPYKFS